jgi:hypothetical protein
LASRSNALPDDGVTALNHFFLFYVRGEFMEYVKDFKVINERICYLRLKAKWFSCTLINVHAPMNEKQKR